MRNPDFIFFQPSDSLPEPKASAPILFRKSILHEALLKEARDRIPRPCAGGNSSQSKLAGRLHRPFKALKHLTELTVAAACALFIVLPSLVFAEEATALFNHTFSGYAKTLNFFTRTSGLTPEMLDNPLDLREAKENLFDSLERFRGKLRSELNLGENRRVVFKIDYDHQAHFGSFVSTGDFRISRRILENRQFLDLSQTLVEDDDAFYEHRLYRASIAYETEHFDLEIGRQQIPWGVGRFFTPTDVFNPFNPTQIELDERDGVDAVNFTTKSWEAATLQLVYTPPGRQLHPQRYLARLSRDFWGFETGLLGGRVKRDHAVGFDLAGNIRDSAVRAEFLYREAELEKDFIKFTINADYNFPHNIYALLEYHFNGQGRRHPEDYQLDRLVRGEIEQLGRNYTALSLGYDLTELLRLEYRTIFNLDDLSFFMRPELQYEWQENMLFTLGSQLYLGENVDEFGRPKNLFLGEMKYSF